MAQKEQLRSVSLMVDNGSVKERVHKVDVGQRPRSFSHSHASLRPVPEVDGEEEGANFGRNRISFTKNGPSRANSLTSLSKSKRAYDNAGYDDRAAQFERGYADSTRSSVHDSVASLQVQREQYCCCARWTVFERRLAVCVGVLAAMIFALAIAVGILAGDDGAGVDEKLILKP